MLNPGFLFAHGAGAGSGHHWMQAWKRRLETIGPVFLFDYPYITSRRGRPDPMPSLVNAHRAALRHAQSSHTGPVVLAGKSLGSRVGCHLALEEPVPALICFGYPLLGGGDPSKARDRALLSLERPVLFLQGTRDKLCPLPLLESILPRMKTTTQLHIVETGDHSLVATKTRLKMRGESQEDVDARVIDAITAFIGGLP